MERDFAGNQDRVGYMDAGSWFMIVVEINVGVVRADSSRVEPTHAAITEKHVLTAPAMIGTVAVTDEEEIFMIRLVGNHRYLRRISDLERTAIHLVL